MLSTALATAAVLVAAQSGHTLALSGPASATVGEPATYQATGVVPDDVFLNRYLNVYAIPTSVVPSCPATFQNAMQLSYASADQGGDTVANTVPAEGSFTLPFAYTPTAGGSMLLCGYIHEGVETMAVAGLGVSVGGGGGGGGGAAVRPAAVKKPSVKRSASGLKCRRGTWSGSPSSFKYRWRVGSKRIAGAKRAKLRVTRKLEGRKVRCAVTATNGAGSTTVLSRVVRAPTLK